MVDQCHNIEPKVPAMLRTVAVLQQQWLKAQLIDRSALRAAQDAGDILAANDCLRDAYETDVRPTLERWREARGLPRNPVVAYETSGEPEARTAARQGGVAAGWG
jgi:L-rhamnose isomerase/sugar isomerase